MSFKLHLIIISCITVAVVLFWQLMHSGALTPADTRPARPQYNLTITHASWGLNCRNLAIGATGQDAFARKPATENPLRDDNVLGAVGLLCNGKTECAINVDAATLGKDPAPDCANKVLEVEYRCFSYDRPWSVKTSTGTLTLHCEQPSK